MYCPRCDSLCRSVDARGYIGPHTVHAPKWQCTNMRECGLLFRLAWEDGQITYRETP